MSEDIDLRLFETRWGDGKITSFVEQPLFLLAAPVGLIRKWTTVSGVPS